MIEIYDDQESTTEPLTVYTYNDTSGAVGGTTNPFFMKTETRPDLYHNNAGGAGYELASISYLDGLGRTLQTVQLDGFRDSNNNDQHVRTSVAYDALGRTICTTSPEKVTTIAYTNIDCLAQSEITTQTYDEAGRVASITDVDGSVTRQYYGHTGGNETYVTTIDANHHRTQTHTDMWGNLVASIEFTGNCTDGYTGVGTYNCDAGETAWTPYTTAEFEYDLKGNLTTVTRTNDYHPVNPTVLVTTTMTYDDLGRKITMDDPDMGDWQYEYDLFGNLTWQKDAKNQEICFEYDDLNRLTEKYVPEVAGVCALTSGRTSLATYFYDGPNGLGQLQQVKWGDDQDNNYDTFIYDERGRVVENTRVIHGREYTQKTISFDLFGRPLNVQYPDGEIVTLTYDGQGENTLQAGTNVLVDNLTYNERGQMTGLYRHQQFNTMFYYYDYSGNPGHPHRLEMIANGTNSDAIPDFKYSYDNVGNITRIREFHTNSSSPVDDQRFAYDELNRLTDAYTTVGYGNAGYDHEYFYDELGNIDSWDKDGQLLDYTYGINRPHSVININTNEQLFTYDPNGNMKTREDETGKYTQTFDIENRLTRVYDVNAGVGQNDFEYDHSGQRVVSSDGANMTYYPFPNFQETVTFETVYETDFEDTTSWNAVPSTDFPATSIWQKSWGTTSPESGTQSVAISNLMNGRVTTERIYLNNAGTQHTVTFYARGVLNEALSEGSWFAKVYYKDGSEVAIGDDTSTKYKTINANWTQYTFTFTPPSNTAFFSVALISQLQSGWVAFDNFKVSDQSGILYETGFEIGEESEWIPSNDVDFPATAVWARHWGIAAPYAGSQAVSISNLMMGTVLTSPIMNIEGGEEHTVEVYARGSLDTSVSEIGQWFIRVHYRDGNNVYLGSDTSTKRDVINANWTQYTFNFTPPKNTDRIQVMLSSELQSGWLAFDDLVIKKGVNNILRSTGFESDEQNEWYPYSAFTEFTGMSTWNNSWGTATPKTGSQAVTLSNFLLGRVKTPEFDVEANKTYIVDWSARGAFDVDTGYGNWDTRVYYYDANNAFISWENIYTSESASSGWTNYTASFTPPAGTDHVTVDIISELQTGWLAIDNLKILAQDSPIEAEQRSKYSVAGQAIAQRQADVAFNDTFASGTKDKWIDSSQWSVSNDLLSSQHSTNWIHMGAEVSQQGLTHYSWEMTMDASASGSSRGGFAIFGQIGSAGNMGDSYFFYQDGGALRLYRFTNGVAANLQGASAPRVIGKTHVYRASYDPATGNMQVWRDGVKLIDFTDPNPIQTGNYVAVRGRYGPIHFDNIRVMQETGLTYMVTDHLGSSRALVDTAGSVVAGSLTHFAPFGGYRGNAPSTNPELLENGYTGHKHNDDIGLIYMNARYYVLGIGRFASADTIIPDPSKPQSYNRYSYVQNNPLRYIDPDGHRSCSPEQIATGDETCDENIIDYEWLAFKRKMQTYLTGRYGYHKGKKIIFASGPNEYTPDDVITRPSSIEELNAMMEAGEDAVYALGNNPVASCHPMAGAMNGYYLPDYFELAEDNSYHQDYINEETDAILFEPEMRLHSATVVIPNTLNPENTLLIQTNQGAHLSGIFFSTLGRSREIAGDAENITVLNLPERQPIQALEMDNPVDEIPSEHTQIGK